jgi:hypothetical protein
MRLPLCTNTHKYGSAACNGPVQASRFRKHSHSSERALTLRTC